MHNQLVSAISPPVTDEGPQIRGQDTLRRTMMLVSLLLFPMSATAFLTAHVAPFSVRTPHVHRSLSRPSVMKVRDDTTKSAEAESAREAEAARLAAEADADPEPGPCIACGDAGTYWDGMVTFACTSCGHEWGIEEAKAAEEELITRDVNGAELKNGDQVVLTKDLAKGSLKKGLKVRSRLRLRVRARPWLVRVVSLCSLVR